MGNVVIRVACDPRPEVILSDKMLELGGKQAAVTLGSIYASSSSEAN